MSNATETNVKVMHYKNGSSTGSEIKNVTSIVYTDCATDVSDTITVSTCDQSFCRYMPSNKDKIECSINQHEALNNNVHFLSCGTFLIDRFGFDGIPYPARTSSNVSSVPIIELGGIATPRNQDFQKSTHNKNWGNTALVNILCEIANRYGLSPYYFVSYQVYVRDLEQQNQSDCDFLITLCKRWGLALKVYNNRLIVYDEVDYEAKDTVRTITPTLDVFSFSSQIELIRQYTGYKGQYKSANGTTHSYSKWFVGVTPSITYDVGTVYDFNELCSKGAAAVNDGNKNMTIVNILLKGDPRLSSTSCVELAGFSVLDGKYFINKAIHTVNNDVGYTTQIEARKLIQRLD